MEVIGEVKGDSLLISGLIDLPILKAYEAWAFGFEDILKNYV
jgi:hypothetical protein